MADQSVEEVPEYEKIKHLREIDNLSGLIQIMVFLYKFDRGNITNFVKDLRMNQQPVYRTIGKLRDLGLVDLEVEPPQKGTFASKNYFLTDEGLRLGQHFEQLYETYRDLLQSV